MAIPAELRVLSPDVRRDKGGELLRSLRRRTRAVIKVDLPELRRESLAKCDRKSRSGRAYGVISGAAGRRLVEQDRRDVAVADNQDRGPEHDAHGPHRPAP